MNDGRSATEDMSTSGLDLQMTPTVWHHHNNEGCINQRIPENYLVL